MRAPAIGIVTGLAVVFASIGSAAAADRASIRLLPETATLKPSPHPGYQLATQKCGACHSADYVEQQPPSMTTAQWTAEVTKMKKAYGAPLDDDDIREIGAYLAVAYGTATPTPPVAAATAAPIAAPAPAPARDIATLLSDSGCLACHTADRKVFGPAYHDIALRYRADAAAVDTLAASIRAGSAGKWGAEAMPPFAKLSDGDAKALAGYVLKQ